MRQLLIDVDVKMKKPTTLFIDNQGAIVWGREGVRHAEHVEITRNYVLELVRENIVEIRYCDTAHMAADLLTKSLQRTCLRGTEALSVWKIRNASKRGYWNPRGLCSFANGNMI